MNAKIKFASTAVLLFGALQQAAALKFERDDTMRDSGRTYANDPVIIEENDRVGHYNYDELTDAEKLRVQTTRLFSSFSPHKPPVSVVRGMMTQQDPQ